MRLDWLTLIVIGAALIPWVYSVFLISEDEEEDNET